MHAIGVIIINISNSVGFSTMSQFLLLINRKK